MILGGKWDESPKLDTLRKMNDDATRTQILTSEDSLSRKYEVVVSIKQDPRMVIRVPIEAQSEMEACHKVLLRGIVTPEHGRVNYWQATILKAEEVND